MDIKNLLILSMVKGIGPAFIKKNLNRISNESSVEKIILYTKPSEIENLDNYSCKADEIISDCRNNGIDLISVFDEGYPQQLLEISDPPCVLFMKGNRGLLNKVIAIIGTRKSSDLGNKIAERVGDYFSNWFSICNGLVEGIDEHSIYINGKVLSNVVGIISGGLCYKETCTSNHIKVIEDVLNAEGLVISEFYPRQKEDKFSGSKASRIQAGLSQGLILVQSSVDGGSKYTLAKYSKLGRPLGIIHFPNSEEYSSELFGANRLIAVNGKAGLAQMLELKKASSLNSGNIIVLKGREDYEIFVNELNCVNRSSLF